jgi:hypothetical protein
MKKIDGWDTKANGKFFPFFFVSVPNGVEHEKKAERASI